MLIFFIADKIAIRYGLLQGMTSVDLGGRRIIKKDTPVLLQ